MIIELKRKNSTNTIILKKSDIIKDKSVKIIHDLGWDKFNYKEKTDLNYFKVEEDTFIFLAAKKGEDIIPGILGANTSKTNGDVTLVFFDDSLKDLIYNEYKATIFFCNANVDDAPSISIDCDLVIDSTLPNPKKETVLPPDIDDNEDIGGPGNTEQPGNAGSGGESGGITPPSPIENPLPDVDDEELVT